MARTCAHSATGVAQGVRQRHAHARGHAAQLGRRVARASASDVAQDVPLRDSRRSAAVPATHSSSIAVLALGIGANVSVFRLFNALALKPIPGVEGSARLGVLVARTDAGRILPLSHPDFRDLRELGRSFAGLAGTSMDAYSLGLGTRGERVFGEMVTGNYFPVLGVRASLGRTLLPSDDVSPGKHPVVVISDDLWRRAFASDPAIVGKTIQINAYPFTVVGVAEPGFHGSIVSVAIDLFVPVMMQPQLRGRRPAVGAGSADAVGAWAICRPDSSHRRRRSRGRPAVGTTRRSSNRRDEVISARR